MAPRDTWVYFFFSVVIKGRGGEGNKVVLELRINLLTYFSQHDYRS